MAKALYVDRYPLEWKNRDVVYEYLQRERAVKSELAERFDVDFFYNLMSLDDDVILKTKYELMVTHLQDNPHKKEFDYSESIDKIHTMHVVSPNTKIIVYTGASMRAASDETLKEAGAIKIIRKSHIQELEKDLDELRDFLDKIKNN
jgi:hypothetical protein